MNDFNFEMVCITWSVNIFQMTSAHGYKSFMRGKKKKAKCTEFNFDKLKKMFINAISDFTLQLMFKKLFLFEFRCSIKEGNPQLSEKTIKTFFHFFIYVFCVRQDFLHIFQPKQYMAIDWTQNQITENPVLFN